MAIEDGGAAAAGELRPEPHRGRRMLLAAAASGLVGAGLWFVGGDKYGARLPRAAVPGFRWSGGRGFEDPNLVLEHGARLPGDQAITSNNPEEWPNAGLVGTLAVDALAKWVPNARLGVLYTDPGGHWHDGWGEPGQLYGGLVAQDDRMYLAVALREGRDPSTFTLALSLPHGNPRVGWQLPSVLLGDIMPISEIPVGVPLL